MHQLVKFKRFVKPLGWLSSYQHIFRDRDVVGSVVPKRIFVLQFEDDTKVMLYLNLLDSEQLV